MKTILSTIVFIVAISGQAFSLNYEETMAANIQKVYSAKTTEELSSLANQFERIANAEPGKWQPRYYTAFCYTWATAIGDMPADDKHKLLDLAQVHIDNLMKSFIAESEIYALQAFVYEMRITDMGKGMKYSGLTNESLTEAEKLNPNNPRVYYLRGMNTFHTPKAFGGGKEKAQPLFEKAVTLFESQKPSSVIDPAWGAQHNAQMLAECNKEDM